MMEVTQIHTELCGLHFHNPPIVEVCSRFLGNFLHQLRLVLRDEKVLTDPQVLQMIHVIADNHAANPATLRMSAPLARWMQAVPLTDFEEDYIIPMTVMGARPEEAVPQRRWGNDQSQPMPAGPPNPLVPVTATPPAQA